MVKILVLNILLVQFVIVNCLKLGQSGSDFDDEELSSGWQIEIFKPQQNVSYVNFDFVDNQENTNILDLEKDDFYDVLNSITYPKYSPTTENSIVPIKPNTTTQINSIHCKCKHGVPAPRLCSKNNPYRCFSCEKGYYLFRYRRNRRCRKIQGIAMVPYKRNYHEN